ncbi:hypothetical protein CBL_13656 [Carabus blaptoides fortunei]
MVSLFGSIQYPSGQTACVVCGVLRKPTLSNMQIDLTVMDVRTLVVGSHARERDSSAASGLIPRLAGQFMIRYVIILIQSVGMHRGLVTTTLAPSTTTTKRNENIRDSLPYTPCTPQIHAQALLPTHYRAATSAFSLAVAGTQTCSLINTNAEPVRVRGRLGLFVNALVHQRAGSPTRLLASILSNTNRVLMLFFNDYSVSPPCAQKKETFRC